MTFARVRLAAAVAALSTVGLLPASAHAAATCAAQHVTVTPLQSSVFYVDTTSSYLGSYVGYKIANTGAGARTGLWTRLEGFTGGVIAPADGNAATAPEPLSAIPAGGAVTSYAYIKASGATSSAQGHDVVVYSGRPGAGGAELCRQTQAIGSVQQVIKASANKVTGASLSTASAELGGTFALTVTGDTGTIGSGIAADPGVVRFSPAVAASWPASAFRLVSVSHQLPLGGSPIADLLSRSNLSGAAQDYSVTYTFRVVGSTASSTPVVPVSNIASGTQVKHTDPGSFASLAPIPKVTSSTTMSVSAGGTGPYTSGATVPLHATITNAGSTPVTLDALELHLPGTWTAAPGTFTRDGAPIADAYNAGGGHLELTGPYTVAAGGSSTFGFDSVAGAPGTTGSYTAAGTLDGAQIDATTDPSDDRPATATLTVLGPPTARDDAVSAASAVARDIPVLANDDVTGTPTITIESAPANGTASVSGDHITYTSADGYTGPDAVTYRVTTSGGSATAVAHVDVEPLPAPPTAIDVTSTGVGTAAQHQDLAVPANGGVTLLDGSTPVTELSVAGQGDYALDPATGRVTFTPVSGFTGQADPAPYRATDAFGQTSATARYTPTVTPPTAPSPADVTSTGQGTETQGRTLTAPAGGSLLLVDGAGHPALAVTVAGQGTYVLDPTDDRVTFTPQLGFTGTGAVTYRATDAYGQHGDATYRPTVTLPAGPSAAALSSTGVGTATQSRTADLPEGGTVRLLAGGTPATTVTVPGEGTYTLDMTTGAITFSPRFGFAGTAAGVTYRITDAYGQHDDATYLPAVTAPPLAAPAALTTTGAGIAAQQPDAVAIPNGGSVQLLDAGGAPVTTVTVAGQGTYTLDAATGTIRFVPVLGFTGAATPVSYRITDAYGQTRGATYTPRVTLPAAPAAPTHATTGAPAEAQTDRVAVPEGGTAMLVGPDGSATTRLVVEGVGTYEITPATGAVRFVPADGFAGTPPAVRYRVTDAYGQSTDGAYTATVSASATPAAAAPSAAAPVPTTCLSRRTTLIHWKVDAGRHVRRIAITLNGKAYKTLPGSARKAVIDLRGRPLGLISVRVAADAGRVTLTTTRVYRTCTPKMVGKPLATLHLRAAAVSAQTRA